MERVFGIDGAYVAFGSADDPNALSNPNLIWLAERPAAPTPTPAMSSEVFSYAGFHLYRIYAKLGITSRAQLHAALGG